MTVINTVREVISMPVQGITHSSQPVMGYNYGAKEYGRVKKAIVFVSAVSVLYTLGVWSLVHAFPEFFIRIFNRTGDLVEAGIPAMRIYFFGFFHDGVSVCRTGHLCWSWKSEKCGILLYFP